MSRAHLIDRHCDREEQRLSDDFAAGLITRADYNEGLRDLQREARDAYQADMDDAADRVRDEWGGVVMPWAMYYLVVAVLVLGGLGLRHAYRSAVARQAARDAAALAAAKFGRRFMTPEMGQPHDQAKAEQAHAVAVRTERRHRKVAASRAVAPAKPVASPKVTPMRRAK